MLALRLLLPKLSLPAVARRPRPSRVKQARRTVAAFMFIVLFANVALGLAMDTVAPVLRDTEYVRHRDRYRARKQAHPHETIHAVIGSSRAFHGVRPLDIPQGGPVLGNMSLIGAGPCLQLLTLRRMIHDGNPPDALILEFWPPFLHGTGEFNEFVRLDPHRYFASDEPFIRDYHPNPEGALRLQREIRRTPIWNHRQRILSYVLPSWLPSYRRLDYAWDKLDAAGWMPGVDIIDDAERTRRLGIAADYYKPLFREYEIDPVALRALHEVLATCRGRGIPVTLVWLPESSEFRGWYSPDAERLGNALFAELAEQYGLRAVNARDWVPDAQFADGYHLTTTGASTFTLRLAAVLSD